MLIRCECGRIIDLTTAFQVQYYMSNLPIKCPKCGKDICFKKEDENVE